MENSTDNCRRIPPRSKFNDEESTAVLRLIVEQERLLKKPANPVLNISSEKLKRLPPLNGKIQDSLGDSGSDSSFGFETQRTQRKHRSVEGDVVLSRPTLLKGKEFRGIEELASLGKPKVPDIYSTPKIARPRDRERPRASYGRNSQNRSNSTMVIPREKSNEEYHSFPTTDVALDRPSNPTPLQHEDHSREDRENSSRISYSQNICYDSDEDKIDATEVYASYINWPKSVSGFLVLEYSGKVHERMMLASSLFYFPFLIASSVSTFWSVNCLWLRQKYNLQHVFSDERLKNSLPY